MRGLLPPLPGGAVQPMLFLGPLLNSRHTGRQNTEGSLKTPTWLNSQPCFHDGVAGTREPQEAFVKCLLAAQVWGH